MIRKATLSDAPSMQQLINKAARKGQMLVRPLAEIYENIRDYYVAEEHHRLVGACGLHVNWDDLAEIKSLVVASSRRGRGLGRQLVEKCIEEGRGLGVRRFYALTYIPDFFRKLGFRKVSRERLPQKVWSECIRCHHFPDCDEIAMLMEVKGVLTHGQATNRSSMRARLPH